MNNFERYMFLYTMRNQHAISTEENEGNIITISPAEMCDIVNTWNTGFFTSLTKV